MNALRASRRLGILLLTVLAAGGAAAQEPTPEDDLRESRMQFRSLGITPSISLTDFGVDTNVFNDVENPKRDYRFTVSPRLDSILLLGRTVTRTGFTVDASYYKTYASERGLSAAVDTRIEVPGNRITPWAGGSLSNGKQRVGYEVDLRARRTTAGASAGLKIRVAARTQLVLSASHIRQDVAAGTLFLGENLARALARSTNAGSIELRYRLTAFTNFSADIQRTREVFRFNPDRNADSTRVQGGFDLAELALIGGQVRVGYRVFEIGGGLPGYSGAVASAATGITLFGRTRFQLDGYRDVDYSFESVYPYYVRTGGTLTITPRLTERWDVQVRAGGQRLAYRASQTGGGLPDRLDRVVLFGGGVGYHLGDDIRIGANLDRQRRRSPVQRRDYEGFVFGTTVTYGR